jgi:hypothetical protein
VADVSTVKYWAFLSYSHRDSAWGKWLHAALERFRIDQDLVGKSTPAGPIPKSLRPIFRDRTDFAAGHSLTERTIAALQASEFLIVLCSPDAARSKYVNEEIRRFKAMGRAHRIIPVVVGGEPGHIEDAWFPPALRFKVGPDGALTLERDEPIAADGVAAIGIATFVLVDARKTLAIILGRSYRSVGRPRAERLGSPEVDQWTARISPN